MTIHDAIASISDSPSSDLTISACINALKIDSPPPNCDADDFLTEELILKFCQSSFTPPWFLFHEYKLTRVFFRSPRRSKDVDTGG